MNKLVVHKKFCLIYPTAGPEQTPLAGFKCPNTNKKALVLNGGRFRSRSVISWGFLIFIFLYWGKL